MRVATLLLAGIVIFLTICASRHSSRAQNMGEIRGFLVRPTRNQDGIPIKIPSSRIACHRSSCHGKIMLIFNQEPCYLPIVIQYSEAAGTLIDLSISFSHGNAPFPNLCVGAYIEPLPIQMDRQLGLSSEFQIRATKDNSSNEKLSNDLVARPFSFVVSYCKIALDQ
jgi:hypothetical protein